MKSNSSDQSNVVDMANAKPESVSPPPPPPLTTFIKVLTFFASIGGFLFGYDGGIMSGAMILLKMEYNLSTAWQELIVSSSIASAAVASFVGAFLNDYLGRKPVIMLASATFVVGSIVMTTSTSHEILFVGKLINGVGVGK